MFTLYKVHIRPEADSGGGHITATFSPYNIQVDADTEDHVVYLIRDLIITEAIKRKDFESVNLADEGEGSFVYLYIDTCAAILPYGAVNKPHGYDETHGTQHADRWKVLNGIKAVVLQNGERGCVRQRDGGHEECHTEGVKGDEQRLIGQLVAEACLEA